MRLSDKKELKEILQAAMRDEACAKAVAADLGKPYFTLMAEINGLDAPEPSRNKLGLVTGIEIIEITGTPLPLLEWECRRFGFLPVALPAPCPEPGAERRGEPLHSTMTRISEEIGDVARALREATDSAGPGGIALTPEERRRLGTEIREAAAALMALDLEAETAQVLPLHERRRSG